MLAHVVLAPARLVDVVADERHQVRVFGREVPVRDVVALLVLLAAGKGDPQFVVALAGVAIFLTVEGIPAVDAPPDKLGGAESLAAFVTPNARNYSSWFVESQGIAYYAIGRGRA